jgi:LysR family hydrogen peroxide-inducible transcriptional activator
LEFRQILYVLKIAEEKNFSRAAEQLHVAQPSLSQQLSKLEKELGVLLFDRTTNSVELTYAGERFIENAVKIIDLSEQLKKEMQDISEIKKGKLIVGSMPMTGAHLLPKVLPVFRNLYPDVEITLVEETSFDLEALTSKGKTDISLLSLPLREELLDWVPIYDEEICVALPSDHPMARKGKIHLQELKDEPFILLKKGQGLRNMAFDLCSAAGFTPHVAFESSNVETVQSLVVAGMGVAFVPRLVARTTRSSMLPSYVSLDPIAARTLVLAYKKGRYLSKAADAFIKVVKELTNVGKPGNF